MMQEHGELLKNTFRNPFDDFNASLIDAEKVVELWCEPVINGTKELLSIPSFYTNPMPFIIQGSRGSGKTMLFKYFSYEAQKKIGLSKGDVFNYFNYCGGVGFYFRCDSSFINSLRAVCYNAPLQDWENVFSYYMDMHIAKNVLNVICDLERDRVLCPDQIDALILKTINAEYPTIEIKSIRELEATVACEIKTIHSYKDQFIYINSDFNFQKHFHPEKLSEVLIKCLKTKVSEFHNINFVLMVDEYEALPSELQRSFNTMMKYANDIISLRIGRRTEKNVETATINETEYLRVNNDYLLVNLDEKVCIGETKKYFYNVAQKRLNSIFTTGEVTIKSFLGEEEDLLEECKSISKGRKEHITKILQEDPKIKEEEIQLICNNISNPENPIMEMLNALWVIRSKEADKVSASTDVSQAMKEYTKKINSRFAKKYHNDYQNKYRYALTSLLCSVYKKNKMYYSFNTVAHLSNGNTRTFINLCRAIVSDAIFYETDSFFESMHISNEVQSKAIHKFSASEFDDICAIIQYGNHIRNLVLNLGNVFSQFHKDRKVRYPETNQFVVNQLELDDIGKNTLSMAQRWSLIIQKDVPQRLSVDINKRGDIFYINRMFSPLFNISYRTRGGFNISLDKIDFEKMCVEIHSPKAIRKIGKDQDIDSSTAADHINKTNQLSLFDYVGDETNE